MKAAWRGDTAYCGSLGCGEILATYEAGGLSLHPSYALAFRDGVHRMPRSHRKALKEGKGPLRRRGRQQQRVNKDEEPIGRVTTVGTVAGFEQGPVTTYSPPAATPAVGGG